MRLVYLSEYVEVTIKRSRRRVAEYFVQGPKCDQKRFHFSGSSRIKKITMMNKIFVFSIFVNNNTLALWLEHWVTFFEFYMIGGSNPG